MWLVSTSISYFAPSKIISVIANLGMLACNLYSARILSLYPEVINELTGLHSNRGYNGVLRYHDVDSSTPLSKVAKPGKLSYSDEDGKIIYTPLKAEKETASSNESNNTPTQKIFVDRIIKGPGTERCFIIKKIMNCLP